MKIYRLLVFVVVSLFAQFLQAQQIDCPGLLKNGKDLYGEERYADAAEHFNMIITTCGRSNPELLSEANTWLSKCNVSVSLSKKELVFNAEGNENGYVEVRTHARQFSWVKTPDKTTEWCHVSIENKRIVVSCDDNFTGLQRSATLKIDPIDKSKKSKRKDNASLRRPATLTITQNSAAPELTFNPDSVMFKSNRDTMEVTVTTNALKWSVDTVFSWLTIVEKREDALVLACSENISTSTRETQVMVEALGQKYPLQVFQLPGKALVEVEREELVFPQEGAKENVRVTSNMSGWNATVSDTAWMEVTKKKGAVTVTVKENPTVFSRHGFVTVKMGTRTSQIEVHQQPKVSDHEMPDSELSDDITSDGKVVHVTSFPPDLKVYIDDVTTKNTPFNSEVDYMHHTVQVGFERRDFIFNEEQNISFTPGLRFANITFTSPKNIGLRSGFVTANKFGAYSHFQASRPLVKEFVTDTITADGYHFLVGPVYQPIPYLGAYAGLGFGMYNGTSKPGLPRFNWDVEAGVMGFYKNVMLTMGFRTSKWNFNETSTTFVLGLGGYLKRYYDKDLGYCSSDSRRWWSVNYMWRPAQNGMGVMVADLGKDKARSYVKAMYLQPADTVKNVSGTVGLLFTPVGGIIDVTAGLGVDFNVAGEVRKHPYLEAELGFILNLWRIPITVMLHESNFISNDKHLFVDFGVGFHFGEFKKSTYK